MGEKIKNEGKGIFNHLTRQQASEMCRKFHLFQEKLKKGKK